MFINFSAIIEWVFKSFDIGGDTKLLQKLEKDGVRFVMIIKKHWIYSILISWRILFVIVIACVNIYLLVFSSPASSNLNIAIASLLAINIFWWLIIVIIYIRKFARIQGNEPYAEDIYSAMRKSEQSDIAFENFFNQTIFLLVLLFGITVFTIFTTISGLLGGNSENLSFGFLNVFLLLIELGLFYGYLTVMINQEMDFKMVVPGQILFYNQRGVFGDSQSMNAEKIKTMNAKHAGLFGSFINYGNIVVLTEGDSTGKGQMDMDYVGNPVDTVKDIQKVLAKDFAVMEQSTNILLQKFSSELGINSISSEEDKRKIRDFIRNNESRLQEIFKNGDNETKKEVRELYIFLHQ